MNTITSDLIAFIAARLDEDERAALAASPWPWSLNEEHDTVLAVDGEVVAEAFALSSNQLRKTAEHIARHDPARVLREVKAKRATIESHRWHGPDGCEENQFCPLLTAMAAAYADHADYRAEWAP